MAVISAVGGVAGAALLLVAPGAFTTIVPWLLVLAAGLAAIQPRVAEALRRREALAALAAGTTLTEPPPPALVDAITRPLTFGLGLGIALTGVYGGYFGAAQGVILLALLGIAWSPDLHRANGAKVVLAGVANLVSAVVFVLSGLVDWRIAGLIATFIRPAFLARDPAILLAAIADDDGLFAAGMLALELLAELFGERG